MMAWSLGRRGRVVRLFAPGAMRARDACESVPGVERNESDFGNHEQA
jgi:hypothetical protein